MEKLIDRRPVQRVRMLRRVDEVRGHVILDHFGHQRGHCPARARDLMENRSARRLTLERTLDRLDLAAEAAHAIQEADLVGGGMHGKELAYPPPLCKVVMLRLSSFLLLASTPGRIMSAGLAAALICGAPANAEPVALTFDDLPVAGMTASSADARTVTARLLAGLKRAGVRATGFVNEGKLAGPDRVAGRQVLEIWLKAGMSLGNHGYSHLSFSATPLAAYMADAAAGDAVTRPLMAAHGKREHWWRYPFLETGTTAEAKIGFEKWLTDHKYRIAPVTMENSDYLFASAYDAALSRGDAAGAEGVKGEYLDYTRRIVAWYRTAAEGLLGRRPAFVFLLHASRLNSEAIGSVTAILRDEGLRFVSLDKTVRDPAYRVKDSYVGPDGEGWLTRWSLTLRRDLPWSSLPALPKDVAASG